MNDPTLSFPLSACALALDSERLLGDRYAHDSLTHGYVRQILRHPEGGDIYDALQIPPTHELVVIEDRIVSYGAHYDQPRQGIRGTLVLRMIRPHSWGANPNQHPCHLMHDDALTTVDCKIRWHESSGELAYLITYKLSSGGRFGLLCIDADAAVLGFTINEPFLIGPPGEQVQLDGESLKCLLGRYEPDAEIDLERVARLMRRLERMDAVFSVVKYALAHEELLHELAPKGIAKLHSLMLPYYEACKCDRPHLAAVYRSLVQWSGKTVRKVKLSKVFNDTFRDVNDLAGFVAATEVVWKLFLAYYEEHNSDTRYRRYTTFNLDDFVALLPDFSAKRKDVLQKGATGAFAKLMQDVDFLDISAESHPRTWAAINDGSIPLSTFFRKSEAYFTFNDNWDLWEEMLQRYPDEAIALAGTVHGRTTYEKDLMSYFYFLLYALPEYLEEHTGVKWTCRPRLVDSERELDPPKEDEDRGVAKTRSALTPIVDNDRHEVTVPYASLKVYGGVSTTYCYGLDYVVLRRGLSYGGNACVRDVEQGLNGRDDYGLMFYTLTGSAQGRGYPTFLIIFERLEEGNTRVHFHRTHPMRSKDGDYNPIHRWIIGAYKWMVGNVAYARTKAQQGDLVFVHTDRDPDGEGGQVSDYDSHHFETPVTFYPYAGKQEKNLLGFVRIDTDTILHHPEHLDRVIPAGRYEIRQCRSWEANPRGVWTLSID